MNAKVTKLDFSEADSLGAVQLEQICRLSLRGFLQVLVYQCVKINKIIKHELSTSTSARRISSMWIPISSPTPFPGFHFHFLVKTKGICKIEEPRRQSNVTSLKMVDTRVQTYTIIEIGAVFQISFLFPIWVFFVDGRQIIQIIIQRLKPSAG